MANPLTTLIGRMSIVAVSLSMPLAAMAQQAPGEEQNVLLFSGLGAPELEELPFEVNDDSDALPPLDVTDLGTTVAATDVPTVQASRTIVHNTWAIGVFR